MKSANMRSALRRLLHRIMCQTPYAVQKNFLLRQVVVGPGDHAIPLLKWRGRTVHGWYAWKVNSEDIATGVTPRRRTCTRCGSTGRRWSR